MQGESPDPCADARAMFDAVRNGDTEYILDHPEHVNSIDDHESSPLIIAAVVNNPTVTNLLIFLGAHIFHRDSEGMSALDHAAVEDHMETTTALTNFYRNDDYLNTSYINSLDAIDRAELDMNLALVFSILANQDNVRNSLLERFLNIVFITQQAVDTIKHYLETYDASFENQAFLEAVENFIGGRMIYNETTMDLSIEGGAATIHLPDPEGLVLVGHAMTYW